MNIFVALTSFIIAAVIAKDMRIENEPGLRLPGSGMAYNSFFVIVGLFLPSSISRFELLSMLKTFFLALGLFVFLLVFGSRAFCFFTIYIPYGPVLSRSNDSQ